MPNSFTVEIDGDKMREALEGESLRNVIKGFIKVASRESADHVCAEMKARLQRQLSGHSTGLTVESIVVKSDKTGWGWIVDAGNATMPMLDRWLEGDTAYGGFKNAARRKPFFWQSVQLEDGPHQRRIEAAVGAALSEYGLGSEQAG